MPHKLYDCCDRNTCICGRGERHGISGNLSINSDGSIERKSGNIFTGIATELLENEIRLRRSKARVEMANKKINQKIVEKEKYIQQITQEVEVLKKALLKYEG